MVYTKREVEPEMTDELLNQPVLKNAKVAFRDLRVTDVSLRNSLLESFEEVLANGPLLMGPRVEHFERRLAAYCDCSNAIGVASGTCALYLGLRALGIGAGDEVVTTPMSWVATLNAILMTGAKPVFVDVGNDQNIDPALVEPAITQYTRAIVTVHFTGRLCDMTSLSQLAKKHNLFVIEDAAQAFGAKNKDYKAGSAGDVAAFSLNPMKVFPGYGEAGALVTNDEEVAKRIRALRYLGTERKEVCKEVSLNHKMDELQAALLLHGFERIDALVDARIDMARRYSVNLSDVVGVPAAPEEGDRSSNFFDYVIFSDRRDELRSFLHNYGVETKVKHPVLLCDHPVYRCEPRPVIPVADRLVNQMISLPLHEKMKTSDLDYVCQVISEFANGR